MPVATALGDMSITDLNDLKVDVADSTKERALALRQSPECRKLIRYRCGGSRRGENNRS